MNRKKNHFLSFNAIVCAGLGLILTVMSMGTSTTDKSVSTLFNIIGTICLIISVLILLIILLLNKKSKEIGAKGIIKWKER